jgi:pilus assembly protein Flp/PilA
MSLLRRFVHRYGTEEGQGLVEYALIISLIAIVAIVALIFIGETVSTTLSRVGSSV